MEENKKNNYFLFFLSQGPGKLFVLLPSSSSRFIKFHFGEEVLVSGMLITTKKEHALRRFKVSANTRLSDPYDYTSEPQLLGRDFNVG